MIFITEKKPILNKQWDYIRAKLFLEPIMFLIARTKHVTFVLCFFFCHSELCNLSYVFVFLSSILSLDNDVSDIKTRCKALFAIFKLWTLSKIKPSMVVILNSSFFLKLITNQPGLLKN